MKDLKLIRLFEFPKDYVIFSLIVQVFSDFLILLDLVKKINQ